MAYGFGPTLGTDLSDSLSITGLTPTAGNRSYFIRAKKNGPGGLNFGRFFEANNGTAYETLFWNSTSNVISFHRTSSVLAAYNIAAPSNPAEEHSFGLSKNFGNTSAPAMYLDGVSKTVTTVTAQQNTVVAIASNICLGNRLTDLLRGFDGTLRQFYAWNAVLTAQQFLDLENGADPLTNTGWTSGVKPTGLICCMVMDVDAADDMSHATVVSGPVLRIVNDLKAAKTSLFPTSSENGIVIPGVLWSNPCSMRPSSPLKSISQIHNPVASPTQPVLHSGVGRIKGIAMGLEVYDSSGRLTLSSNGRLVRFHSRVQLSGYTRGTPYEIWVPVTGMMPDGTWFVFGAAFGTWDVSHYFYPLEVYSPFSPNITIQEGGFTIHVIRYANYDWNWQNPIYFVNFPLTSVDLVVGRS